jgi:hypothetical protein
VIKPHVSYKWNKFSNIVCVAVTAFTVSTDTQTTILANLEEVIDQTPQGIIQLMDPGIVFTSSEVFFESRNINQNLWLSIIYHLSSIDEHQKNGGEQPKKKREDGWGQSQMQDSYTVL